MKMFRIIVFVVLVFCFAWVLIEFSYRNAQDITVQIPFGNAKVYPLSASIFLSFGAGFALALLLTVVELLRTKVKLSKMKRFANTLQKEIDALRNQPLYGEPSAYIPEKTEAAPSSESISNETIQALEALDKKSA